MLRVNDSSISASTAQLSRVPLGGAPESSAGRSAGRSAESTISSASQQSYGSLFFRVIFSPFKLLGKSFIWIGMMIRNLVCCSCIRSKKLNIDWKETRLKFQPIYMALCAHEDTSQHLIKHFQGWLNALPPNAFVRFLEYVGYAIAEREHGQISRAAQQQWFKKNKDNIHYGSNYFQNLEDSSVRAILECAAKNFQAEIAKN